jgi:predicted Zn-dependent protease
MNTRFIIAAVIALLIAYPAHSAVKLDPVYEAQAVPEKEDESALWERASSHENRLRNAGTIFHDAHIEKYIESLTDRMVGTSLDHLGITIDFVLVEEPTLSAWAYPYGTIGLHTGLLVRMDNEAQFAAILAHEISHFLQRHTYREMLDGDKQSKIGKGLGLLAGLAMARETGSFDQGIMDFAGDLWNNLATSGYSKKNEYVADEEGLMLMARAGLSRDEAIPAFEALGENSVYGAGDPRKMWSSHPRLEDRIDNLEKDIKKEKRQKDYVAGSVPDPLIYYRGIAPALIMNARLDISARQFDRAREALTKYLMVEPDDPEAYFLLGEAYRKENPQGPDFAPSQAAYRSALEQDSAYAPAHKELGMTHRVQRQNEAARAAFEEYLVHAEDAPDAGIIRAYLENLQ